MTARRSRLRALAWLGLIGIPAASACEEVGAGRVEVGGAAPAYEALTLDGVPVSLQGLAGNVVLLNVWATYCHPCREEMPGLQTLQQRYGDEGLRVLAVSIDHARAGSAIRSFLDDLGIEFTVLHDPESVVSRAFRTVGVPETFLLDRDGRIAARWIGQFDPLGADALARIEAALAAPL
jgi:peroxiredoxin